MVAGLVTLGVVDLLEAIDVGEGEHETAARPASALDLALHLAEPEHSCPGAGQPVRRGELEIVFRFGTSLARLLALLRGSIPLGGGPDAIVGCLRPIDRRPSPVALSPKMHVLGSLVGVLVAFARNSSAVTKVGGSITKICCLVTKVGGFITNRSRLRPRRRRLVAEL